MSETRENNGTQTWVLVLFVVLAGAFTVLATALIVQSMATSEAATRANLRAEVRREVDTLRAERDALLQRVFALEAWREIIPADAGHDRAKGTAIVSLFRDLKRRNKGLDVPDAAEYLSK